MIDCKQDFPGLRQQVNGYDLVYLDNAATTQQPQVVIDAMVNYIQHDYANTHGGIHSLSQRSLQYLMNGKEKVAAFIGAKNGSQIAFTPGATYSLNLLANSYFANLLQVDDVVVTTIMEHHSNLLPWQQLCKKTGAKLEVVGLTAAGELDLEQLAKLLKIKPKVLAITHVSNVLGIKNDLKKIIKMAHDYGCLVVVDGAQAVGHVEINVVDLDCDFYVFSGHKMYAPTGIGVLYAKDEIWQDMQPSWLVGGGIVSKVTLNDAEFFSGPEAFEAGTKNVIAVVGLAAAIDYLTGLGVDNINAHEQNLAKYLYDSLQTHNAVKILGGSNRSALVSFTVDAVHPHDLVMLLDQQGIACRGGHHCAEPLLNSLGVDFSTRVSCGVYNSKADIDRFLAVLPKVCEVLGV